MAKIWIETEHLSGTGMRPHNWTKETPEYAAQFMKDYPNHSGDVTNYEQIKVFNGKDGPFCSLFIMQEGTTSCYALPRCINR